jgi:putative protease
LQHVPERLRVLDFVKLKINLIPSDSQQLSLEVNAYHGYQIIFQKTFIAPADKPTTQSRLAGDLNEMFKILGDFQIECEVNVIGDTNWFIAKSNLKAIKKEIGEALRNAIDSFRLVKQKRLTAIVPNSKRKAAESLQYTIKFDRLEFLSILEYHLQSIDALPIKEIIFEPKRAFLPKEIPEEVFLQIKAFAEAHQLIFRLSVPIVLREWDMPEVKKWLMAFLSTGNGHFEVGNLGGIELLKSVGVDFTTHDISADFTLYALNHLAAEELTELGFSSATLSIEDDMHNLKKLLSNWQGPEPRLIIFKDTPLFIAEACSLTALHNGCPTGKVCGYRTLHIEDEKGERYFVAHESCKSIVYGERAFSIVQETEAIKSLGISQVRLDFLTRQYTEEVAMNVFSKAKASLTIQNTHGANFRGKLL